MKPIYDQAVRAEIRKRMSPPNRETVAEIARSTGITTQTLYNWRGQWQKQGQLVPATSRPPEQWAAADKLAAVIQSAALSGPELGAFCRERGLYPKQLARWRQAAEDANGPSAPSMADQRELQRRNQELIRQNRKLERELQKKEKALAEAAALLMLSKKLDQLWPLDEEH
ncbi:IS3 family transposase ISPa31 [Synechococcus sp. CBW1107]|uniref:transposase n=2 Tax=Synechococcus sp. CBW1107 TaxID=2789857 RepID=UPI001E4D1B7E|nr:transposase [Synechococcus sp. CBW1107]CAK6689559.1 IS3 family transposase ISPa31 [Synechococcus sp. CBW1107]